MFFLYQEKKKKKKTPVFIVYLSIYTSNPLEMYQQECWYLMIAVILDILMN